jgi:arsenate reductase (thioredoxin)
MDRARVLFICVHNSARSRMAEAFLNAECGDFYEAQSAGLEPGTVNPLAAEAMDELGIDIRQKPSQAVFDVWRNGPVFSHVITVCHESEAEGCPIFPGAAQRLHWSFPDPSKVQGDHEQKLAQVREIRDTIREKISGWCRENCR